MAAGLEKLLRPRSVAVFGGREALRVVEQCERMGFDGEIWPVHPRHTRVAGHRCYSSVAALPGVPDAAFIGVNRRATIDILRQLSVAGAGGAVCYASGFLESAAQTCDGADLQSALLEAAGDMPFVGPNCYGLINYLDGALLWPDQHGGRRLAQDAHGVAIISQSSNIAINLTMQQRGLPIAYVLTAGNQARLSLARMAGGLLADPRVSAIGLHIEGFGDLREFERLAAEARRRKVPIVVLKVGRSPQSQAGTLSHTASLAGSEAGTGAFLQRLGIPRVDSLPAFLETLKLLHVHGPLPGFEIASLSCSGGEACLMADAVVDSRLRYRPLNETVTRQLRDTLGDLVCASNPLDYHTFIWSDRAALTRTFGAMLANGADLNLLVLDFPRTDLCDDQDWWLPVEAFADAVSAASGRGAVLSTLPENLPEPCARRLLARGLVPLQGISEAMQAMEAAALIGEAWDEPVPVPLLRGPALPVAVDTVRLDEYSAKALLARHGIPVPAAARAGSIRAAVQAARRLGFPVAVKALGIAHKTEVGAVRLNLDSAAAVTRAARELLPLGNGLLVERMVTGVVAEMLLGMTRDPVFGPVLSIAAGGVFTELIQDSVQLLLPVRAAEVRRALGRLRINARLHGFRGGPAADYEALVTGILALAEFCQAHARELLELDINPFLVRADGAGAVAADALVVMTSMSRQTGELS